MGKGDETRRSILQQALELASEVGLEGLTIGVLAKRAEMSKSGLYAHFDSKEGLQCAVLDTAAEHFVEVVLAPALKSERGLPRLEALFERWLRWESDHLSGGCPFIAASNEFDDRAGPVRDLLVAHLYDMFGSIERAARVSVEVGHFDAALDVEQFAYEYWGILLAFHHFGRLFRQEDARTKARRAFQRLTEAAKAE